jgi:endonuclease/exonuclease/phosphatase family metal-dependent hydrolase
VGLSLLVAALSLCLLPGVAEAAKGKKKKDLVKVASYNLYLGSDLNPAVVAANAGQGDPTPAGAAAMAAAFDNFLNEVGNVLSDVQVNDFAVRARTIAKAIQKHKVDLIGLQEAALWKLEVPTDGGGPPNGTSATTPLIDYIDTLLEALNRKAKTKKQCKAKGLKGDKCYRGYRLVGLQREADVEQPGDFDNDPGPDGVGGAGPGFPPGCATGGATNNTAGFDDTGASFQDPGPGPLAANFDYNGDTGACTLPAGPFATDPPGTSDCAASDQGDTNPAAPNAPTCLFNGVDGDVRLEMRDVIFARKGAGVKTFSVTGDNYAAAHTFSVPVFGGAQTVAFTRGFISAEVSVRGKKFRLVNTHLEAESFGTFREDQASDLVDPTGGPATSPRTVLVGDLNSDPARPPINLPDGDSGSNIAINRLFAAGFRSLSGPGLTGGHGELLTDLSNVLDGGRIDHVLTNSPSITLASTTVLDPIGGGLWASDHGGVLSRLRIPGGKKKK